MIPLTFGERMKQLRIENKLTQEELANKLSLSKSNISKYESNDVEPNIETLNKLATLFNVSLDYLLVKGTQRISEQVKENLSEEKYPEIHDIEKAMEVLLDQPGLMLKGEILNDEDKIILANAIQMGLRLAEEIKENKNKNQ